MAKAAPITDYRKYRAESDAEFPFHKGPKGKKSGRMQGPSGSKWKLSQLNWLGTDHQFGCDLKQIAPKTDAWLLQLVNLFANALVCPGSRS